MSVENRIDYLKYILAKLRTCSFIDDPEKVFIGETAMVDQWRDEKFPFIQLQIVRNSNMGYGDTFGNLDMDFEIAIQGWVRRPDDNVSDEDMFQILKFQSEVNMLIWDLHCDIQSGLVVIPTFEQLGGFSDAIFDYETFEKTSVFLFNFVGKFYQRDQS